MSIDKGIKGIEMFRENQRLFVNKLFRSSMRRKFNHFFIVFNSFLIVFSLSPKITNVHIAVCENSKPFLNEFFPFVKHFLGTLKITSLKTECSELVYFESIKHLLIFCNGFFKHLICFFFASSSKQFDKQSLPSCCFFSWLRRNLLLLWFFLRLSHLCIVLLHNFYIS